MAESGGLLRCDIAIAGGGFVGLSLALALGELPLSVVVVEPLPPARQYPPAVREAPSTVE